jgi:hypothetical protein
MIIECQSLHQVILLQNLFQDKAIIYIKKLIHLAFFAGVDPSRKNRGMSGYKGPEFLELLFFLISQGLFMIWYIKLYLLL